VRCSVSCAPCHGSRAEGIVFDGQSAIQILLTASGLGHVPEVDFPAGHMDEIGVNSVQDPITYMVNRNIKTLTGSAIRHNLA
jgi:hypothetical protein